MGPEVDQLQRPRGTGTPLSMPPATRHLSTHASHAHTHSDTEVGLTHKLVEFPASLVPEDLQVSCSPAPGLPKSPEGTSRDKINGHRAGYIHFQTGHSVTESGVASRPSRG